MRSQLSATPEEAAVAANQSDGATLRRLFPYIWAYKWHALAALVRAAGGEPIVLPIAPDDRGAIAEVAAHEAGYANMSFFYKKFAERYGCTPAAYRQRLPR